MGDILCIHPTLLKTERDLREKLSLAECGVLLTGEVRSIDLFEETLFEEKVGRVPIGDVERWMILHHAVSSEGAFRKDPLLSGLPSAAGFIDSVGEVVQQIKLGLVTSADLRHISGFAPGKEAWIKRVFKRYDDLLKKKGLLDSADIRMCLIRQLSSSPVPPRAVARFDEIHFFDVYHFTPFRFELICLLGRMKKVVIHFPLPDDRRKAFGFVERNIEKFQSLEDSEGKIELRFKETFATPPRPLNRFTQSLFSETRPAAIDGLRESVRVAKHFSRYREIEEVADRILRLKGDREWSDFCLVFRDLETYGAIVEDVFRRARIPLHLRRGIPVYTNPMARTLLSVFRAVETDFSRDEVVKLATSQYFSFLPPSVKPHLLEEILIQAGVMGGPPELWKKKLAAYRAKRRKLKGAASAVTKVMKLLTALKKLSMTRRASDSFRRFADVVRLLGPRPVAYADRRSLRDAACKNLFDAVMASAGEAVRRHRLSSSPFGWRDLQRLLLASLGTLPSPDWSGRNQVYALNLYELAGMTFPYLFACGLHEGEFPRHAETGSILSEAEKRNFNQRHAETLLTEQPQSRRGRQVFSRLGESWEEESFLFYLAASSATETLFLSYSSYDLNGGELGRSSFLEDIHNLFPGLKEDPTDAVAMKKDYADQLDRSALEAKLLHDVFHAPKEESGALESYFKSVVMHRANGRSFLLSCVKSGMELTRNRFYLEPDPEKRALLSTPFTGMIGRSPVLDAYFATKVRRTFAPTSLEKYANCPFRFFMEKVIGADPQLLPKPEVEKTVQGTVVHEILEHYHSPAGHPDAPPLAPRQARVEKMRTCAEKVFASQEREGIGGEPALWRITKEQMRTALELFVEQEEALYTKARFAVLRTELEFGQRGKAPVPIAVGGETVYLKGLIDRVDCLPDRGLLRVIDYKYSANLQTYDQLLKPEKYCITSFQIPMYLYAALGVYLEEGILPVRGAYGAYYAVRKEPALTSRPKEPTPFDTVECAADLRALASSEAFGERILRHVQRMEGGDFSVTPLDCTFCRYGQVCRYRKVRKQDDDE